MNTKSPARMPGLHSIVVPARKTPSHKVLLAASPAGLKAALTVKVVHGIKLGAEAARRHGHLNYVGEFAFVLGGRSLAFALGHLLLPKVGSY